MARIMTIAGHNDEAITTPGAAMRELISGLNPDGDGRIFYLTKAMFANEHASQVAVVEFADQDEAVITAANQRLSPIHVPAGDTVIVNFADGEAPFITNCTVGVTNGTLATLSQHGAGYLS